MFNNLLGKYCGAIEEEKGQTFLVNQHPVTNIHTLYE